MTILAKLLLELGVPAPADPLHVKANVRSIPVFVDVSPIGLANHLHGVEPARVNFDDLGGHDGEPVLDFAPALSLFIRGVMRPPLPLLQRPDEPGLWWTHARLDLLLAHRTRPLNVPGVEVLQIPDPDQIEPHRVDLPDLDHFHGLRASLRTARPPVGPSAPRAPLRGGADDHRRRRRGRRGGGGGRRRRAAPDSDPEGSQSRSTGPTWCREEVAHHGRYSLMVASRARHTLGRRLTEKIRRSTAALW